MSGWDVLSGLVSAGVNLFEGNQNRQMQEQFNRDQMALGRENMQMQREFAQSGISWKVADAVRAGIHPLAALGAQTTSFSPVSVGGEAPKMGFGSMGQDLGRALKAAMSEEDRQKHDAADVAKLQKQKMSLENDLLKTEIVSKQARVAGQIGPPIPLPRPGPRRAAIGDPVVVEDDKLKSSEGDVPQRMNYSFWGIPMKAWPGMSDANTIQNRHGDWADNVYGLGSVPLDALYTMGQSGPWKRFENIVRWNAWDEIREGSRDRSRWSRAQRVMRGGG